MDYAEFLNGLVDGVEEEDTGRRTLEGEVSQEMKDSNENKNEKRKRCPGRPSSMKSLREKRMVANSREKKRMRALVRLREQFLHREVGFPELR